MTGVGSNLVRSIVVVASLLALAGCAAIPFLSTSAGGAGGGSNGSTSGLSTATNLAASVPSPSRFDYASRDVEIPYVSPTALLDDSLALEAMILQEQCRFQTPDPLFLVPVWANPFMFNGRMEADQNMRVLSYRSMLSLGLVKGTQQLNTWPVRFATLSDMPSLFLLEQIDLSSSAKLTPDQQQALTRETIENTRRIQMTVERLEKAFNPLHQCPQR